MHKANLEPDVTIFSSPAIPSLLEETVQATRVPRTTPGDAKTVHPESSMGTFWAQPREAPH
eukprot:1121409-Pyramimonas_sp.AAC.1